MKKNVMMRVASALLVAVLMTTCAISGTFAKYTTTDSASDSARVAKWGFSTDSITIDNLFAKSYDDVNASVDDVAPGTSNSVAVSFAPAGGAPEVAYTFTVTVTVTATGDDAATLFSKLTWTVNSTPVTFENGVAQVISNTEYAAGANPSGLSIGWEWPFEVGNTQDAINANDKTDTDLGNGAANIAVTVTYTATQK